MGSVTFPPTKNVLTFGFPTVGTCCSASCTCLILNAHFLSGRDCLKAKPRKYFLYNIKLMLGAKSWDFCLPILSVNVCAVWKVTFSFGTIPLGEIRHSRFPRRTSDLIHKSLWIHEVNLEPFKGSLERALSKTPWFKMDSTILWSCDTCPVVSQVTVTSNEKHCNWPTSCTVWQTTLLCKMCVESLAKGWLQGVSQASASWGSSTSRAVAEPWFRILGWGHSNSGCCLQQVKTGSNYVSCQPLKRSKIIKVFVSHRELMADKQATSLSRHKWLEREHRAAIPDIALVCNIGRNYF